MTNIATGQVDRCVEANPVRFAPVQRNAGFERTAGDLLRDDIEHRLLEIGGDHMAPFSHQFRRLDGEKPGAAAEIEDGHSLSDVRGEEFVGVLKPAAQPAVERSCHEHGADVGGHGGLW